MILISCLSQTFRDSSIPIDDNRLSIPGYSMMRADHPSNTKRGGVCLYYKEHLRIIRRNDISNLKECLVTEITAKNERCFLTYLYRSPSQNREQFQSFCDSLETLMNNSDSLNSSILIINGDFNGKCSKWPSFDTVPILEMNLIPLHRLRVIVKLLTNQPILQTIQPLAFTLFLHLILA